MRVRSLSRWITGICLIGIMVNAGFILPRAAKDVRRISQFAYRDALWRGTYFHRGERMANYLHFVRQTLPPHINIVLITIPNLSSDNMLSTPATQFYLLPWRVRNCKDMECLEQAELKSAILYTTNAEKKLLTHYPGKIQSFDSAWGIYLPPSQPENPNPTPLSTRSGSFWMEAIGAIVLFACLTLAGSFICMGLDLTVQEKIAIGYGLGLFGFSLITAIGWLLGCEFSPLLLIFSAGITMLIGLTFLIQKRTIPRFNLRLCSVKLHQNGWFAIYLAMAVLSAILSIGKAYSVSDEIQLWGLKGYGVALERSLAVITNWGTNTTVYPLHVPILIGGFKQLFGDLLPASKLIFSGFYFCLLLYLDGMFSHFITNRSTRALAVLTLGTVPLVFRHSTLAYANLPFTVYLLTGAILFLGFSKRQAEFAEFSEPPSSNLRGLISALMLCAAMWTRPEGIYFVGLIVISGIGFQLWWVDSSKKHQEIKQHTPNSLKNGFLSSSRNLLVFILPFGIYILLWQLLKRQLYLQPLREEQIFGRAITGISSGNIHLSELGYLLQDWTLRLLNPEEWGAGSFTLIVLIILWLWQVKCGARALSPMFVSGIFMTASVLFLYYLLTFDTNHDLSWWISTSLDRIWMPAFLFLWIGGWEQCWLNCTAD